jgi:hypothetical protein
VNNPSDVAILSMAVDSNHYFAEVSGVRYLAEKTSVLMMSSKLPFWKQIENLQVCLRDVRTESHGTSPGDLIISRSASC